MERLKKYRELLNEGLSNEITYEANLDRIKGNCELDVYNAPKKWNSMYMEGGRAEWSLSVSNRNTGMVIDGAKIDYLLFTFEVEDPETGDIMDDSVEIELMGEDISYERTVSNIGKPDFYLNVIEIDMKGSEDPQKWTYTLDIGN